MSRKQHPIMSVTNEESFTTVAVDSSMHDEEKKEPDEGTKFPMEMVKEEDNHDLLESIESDAFETPALWKRLWDSMNPSVCLSPAMACTHVFLDDDVVDYNSIVPPLLRDLKHPGKPRTAALQRLYRFTDRERHKNR